MKNIQVVYLLILCYFSTTFGKPQVKNIDRIDLEVGEKNKCLEKWFSVFFNKISTSFKKLAVITVGPAYLIQPSFDPTVIWSYLHLIQPWCDPTTVWTFLISDPTKYDPTVIWSKANEFSFFLALTPSSFSHSSSRKHSQRTSSQELFKLSLNYFRDFSVS